MATYFHGSNSEIQSSAPDGSLQTLYLMNPNYVPYSPDAAHHPTHNMLLFSPNNTTTPSAPGHALNLASLPHAPPQQHMIGVTIPASNILGSTNPEHEISSFHGFATTAAAAAPRVHYNLWGSIIDQTPSSAATPSSSSGGGAATGNVSPQMGFHRHGHQQGLSLSLSSQQQTVYNRSLSGDLSAISPTSRGGGDDMRSVILGSKYLKAAQELLDEVVNVGKGIYKDESMERGNKEKMKANRESTSGNGEGSGGGGENGTEGKQVAEFSTAQRQELQMKKSKLVSMLDEVEQRYRQYHHQMQIVISSFEEAASFGAAKSYTALALKTISKQFRCLKDAISSQIKATSKTLGEDDCLGAKLEGSRLRYVDHHLQQQRALQQLGMVQHNAWRPQRGLPERAVSVLRAWLFEHFLHPYPKDSDKVMLAKQTGLTRSQVSNWFINARVRLWKPMVEEMYLEEIKEQEHNNDISLQDNTNNNKSKESNAAKESGANIRLDQIKLLQSKVESNYNNQNTSPTEISNSSLSTSPNMGAGSLQSHSAGNFHLAESSSNKPRIISSDHMHNSPSSILSSVDMERKHRETTREANNTTKFGIEIERYSKDGCPLMTINENNGGDGTYGAFSMEDIGRFNVGTQQLLAPRFHGNGVSLSLGLPHSENNLPLSAGTGTQHGFLSQNIHLGMRLEMGGANGNEFCAINTTPPPSNSHSGTGTYESIDIQNRKRFAAQLLPDFVA